MKKTATLALAFIMLSGVAFAQVNKKEYYDYHKTKLMADYQVNSAGEKNGWFKGYDREGILVYEYNYKNNQWHGLNKEYTTVWGKREIMQSETYKDGVLNGPAVYYGKNGTITGQGNYKDGEKDGKWIILAPYTNYELTEQEIGSCNYVKLEKYYENGAEATNRITDGSYKEYFFPCNKLYREYTIKDGKYEGEEKWYFPTGQLNAMATYDYSKGKKLYLVSKTYYPSGQLKMLEDYSTGEQHFEEYRKDGSPTEMMKQKQFYAKSRRNRVQGDSCLKNLNFIKAKEFYAKVDISDDGNKLLKAVENLESGNNELALKNYDKAIKYFENAKDRFDAPEISSYIKNNIKSAEDQKVQAQAKTQQIEELKKTVEMKEQEYRATFVEVKNTIFVDQNQKPITKDTYPKGEYLFLKSNSIVQDYLSSFKQETDMDQMIIKGNRIIDTIDKMVKIGNGEQYKDLNKQLKKIEDKEQIKTLLGI